MQPLNSIDALGPAFTRTHRLLFGPFRPGRSWKLAASGYVGFVGAFYVPFPLMLALVPGLPLRSPIALLVLLVPTLLTAFLFYLGLRMQCVLFEMVVTEAKRIAPMWGRYGSRLWPWFGVKSALGTGLTLLFWPLLLSRGRVMILALFSLGSSFPKTEPGSQPDPLATQAAMFHFFGVMVSALLPFYAVVAALFILAKLCSSLLEDFALPYYLLDTEAFGASLRRGAAAFTADPVQSVLFVLVKIALSFLGFIAQAVASQVIGIAISIVALVLGLILGLMTALFTHGSGSAAPLIVGGATFYMVILAGSFYVQIFLLGYLFLVLEGYAVYFLAGRYPRLAAYLEPAAGQPFTPPPPPPPPSDGRGGPPLPMDPALA